MKIYTVYFNPSDYPGLYVLRVFHTDTGMVIPDTHAVTANTLDEIRSYIPEGYVRLERFDDDDPVIVEAWI